MAKKPKTDRTTQAGESPAAPPRRRARTLVLLGIAGSVLLLGGGAAVVMRSAASTEASAPERKPVGFVELREMTVNLAKEPNQDHQRFLKFRVALEVNDPKVATEIQPLLPRVEDAFQVFVRELRPGDLEGSAGVYRLREELLRRVNIAVYPAKIDAVLFKDIVVQ